MRRRRSKRGISPLIATVLLIVIVIAASLGIYFYVSGATKPGKTVSVSLAGSGQGSDDGKSATLTIIIQNSGDAPLGVATIYVEPLGVASITSATTPLSNITVAVGEPSGVSTMPSNTRYVSISPHSTQNVVVDLQGSNLYPGVKIKYFVVYYDLSSGKGYVASDTLTLNP